MRPVLPKIISKPGLLGQTGLDNFSSWKTDIPRVPGRAWGGQGSSPGDSGKLLGRPWEALWESPGSSGCLWGSAEEKILGFSYNFGGIFGSPAPNFSILGISWDDLARHQGIDLKKLSE